VCTGVDKLEDEDGPTCPTTRHKFIGRQPSKQPNLPLLPLFMALTTKQNDSPTAEC